MQCTRIILDSVKVGTVEVKIHQNAKETFARIFYIFSPVWIKLGPTDIHIRLTISHQVIWISWRVYRKLPAILYRKTALHFELEGLIGTQNMYNVAEYKI